MHACLADRALTCTVEHLHTRVQFGKPLAKQQGLRFALADLVTAHTAAQLLVYRAAGAKERGEATSQQVAMGKLFATETAQQVIDRIPRGASRPASRQLSAKKSSKKGCSC